MRQLSAPFLLLALAAASSLGAQATTVGKVGEIRLVSGNPGCRSSTAGASTPTAVLIRQDGSTLRLTDGRAAPVLIGDGYRLEKRADARLWITAMGNGALILAPQMLCRLWDADSTIVPRGASDNGSYQISTNHGLLRFIVLSGGAFIQWNSKTTNMEVLAGSTPMLVTGTQLSVVVDNGGGALVYVREGTVTLLDGSGVAIHAGETYELGPRAPPRKLANNASRLAQIASSDMDLHEIAFASAARPVSTGTSSIWHTPWPYVAVGVAGGATYCAAVSDTRCGLRKKSHTATVRIHIPL